LLEKINSTVIHSGSSPRRRSSAHCFHTLVACDLVFSIIFLFAAAIGFCHFRSTHLKHLPLLCFSCLMVLLKGQLQIRAMPVCTLTFSRCWRP